MSGRIQDGVKLFANVEGQRKHEAKITARECPNGDIEPEDLGFIFYILIIADFTMTQMRFSITVQTLMIPCYLSIKICFKQTSIRVSKLKLLKIRTIGNEWTSK